MALPRTGTVKYNGVELPVETRTLGVDIRPEKSADGRTTIANRYTFRFSFYLTDDNAADQADYLESIRADLTRNGGEFIYTSKGLGDDLSINTSASNGDMAYGPWTRLKWTPIGNNLAAKCELEVECLISDCTDRPYKRFMELSWTADYQYGPDRLEQRTIKGHFLIAARKPDVNSQRVPDSADEYFEKVIPAVPPGYERTNESRNISADKRRCDFSVTDKQLAYPCPPGIMPGWSFDHTQTAEGPGYVKYSGTFTGKYKRALDAPYNVGLSYFLAAVADRMKAMRSNSLLAKRVLIPLNFTCRDNVNDLSSDFSLAYTASGSFPALMTAGLWRRLPGHDGNRWAASMFSAYRPGAYSQGASRVQARDDAIVDVCDRLTPIPPSAVPAPDLIFSTHLLFVMNVTCPPPEESWIDYQCWLVVSTDDGLTEHSPLPEGESSEPRPQDRGLSLGQAEAAANFGAGKGATAGDMLARGAESVARGMDEPVVLQQQTAPKIYVTLYGRAVRACWDIEPPRLVSVGGVEAIPRNRDGVEFFASRVVANCGLPIIGACWRLRWLLMDYPTGPMTPPATPTAPRGESPLRS